MILAADDVAKLLKDAGVASDKESMTLMMEKLKGKKIHDLVVEGRGKFASMPSGGAPAAAAPATAAPAKAKKEEKPVEDDDADLDGAMDLFGY